MMHHQMKGKARARNAQKKSLFPLLAFLKYLVVFVTGVYCGTIASFQYNTSSNLECGNANGNEFIRSQSLNGNTDALELKLRACYTDLMNLYLYISVQPRVIGLQHLFLDDAAFVDCSDAASEEL